MKILHTADWHLGKKLEGISRHEEQRDVLQEICNIADSEDVDAILIAGDIFDNYNPSNEAIELFYKTVHRLSKNAQRIVLVIAGNHDSPDRIEAPEPLALINGIFFLGYPDSVINKIELDSGMKISRSEPGFAEFILPDKSKKLRVIFTPFANEYRLRKALDFNDTEKHFESILTERWNELATKYCDKNGVNILLSHHFFIDKNSKPVESPDEEKPIIYVGGTQSVDVANIPEQIDYVALGHLHKFQQIGDKPVYYSGSPLSYSFAEAGQDKFVVLADFTQEKLNIKNILLTSGKKLLRKRFEDTEEAVLWLQANTCCLVELTIRTDKFISSVDRKRLNQAHPGIVALHPELSTMIDGMDLKAEIDTSKSMEELFSDYFRNKKTVAPDDRILDLFREIISK
jgi:DNA repair protein SbcD/Mre11